MHPGRLAPAAGRRRDRGRTWPACSPTRGAPRPTPPRVDRMLAAGAELVDVVPASEALGLQPGAVPARRAADRLGPRVRPAARRADRRDGLRGPGRRPRGRPRRRSPPATASRCDPCHHHRTVGPMAGVVTPSMWMFELRDPVHGGTAFCSLNEGLGKVLRYGAYGPEVIERLRWMSDVLGPAAAAPRSAAASSAGPIDIKAIVAQMLQMGDEGHNRNRAGTLMFLRELLPDLHRVRRADRRRRRRGAVHRRQRPLLPQPRHAGLQAGLRRGPRRPRLDARGRDGPQRHRLRHPGLRHRRPVVHRPGQHPRGPVPRRVRPRGRQPRHRRLGDHRDRRHRRLRDGRGAGDREVRRRRGGRRARGHPADVRDHAGREPGVPGAGARLPRHADRHRRHRW